jgi:hypothetical protein
LLITTTAAAPSEICDADPAVTVPLGEKSGVVAGTARSVQRLDRYVVRHGVEDGGDVAADAAFELFDQRPVGADVVDFVGEDGGHALGDLVLAGCRGCVRRA